MFVGIDWASETHAVCVVDDAGAKLGMSNRVQTAILAHDAGLLN